MAGLELEYEVMQECIDSIQKLSADYAIIERPSVLSEGQSVTELEQLASLYGSFYQSLKTLSEETVSYLNNMVTDFREIDEKRTRD